MESKIRSHAHADTHAVSVLSSVARGRSFSRPGTRNPGKPLGASAPASSRPVGTKSPERARPPGARRAVRAQPASPPYIGRHHSLSSRPPLLPVLRPPPLRSPFPVLLPCPCDRETQREAAMARHFVLNTGAKIPSVGLGTWQSDPGVVGNAVYAAVKVRINPRPLPVFSPLPSVLHCPDYIFPFIIPLCNPVSWVVGDPSSPRKNLT